MKKTSFYGQTDRGRHRQHNEDELIFREIWDENHILGVAIDGVGGYEGGEVAAEIAKNTIPEYLEKYLHGERIVLLQQAVTEANNRIVEEARKQSERSKMSCVLTACLVETEKKQINMVHIGDTRLYQFYDGTLTKLSHDHSYVGYREDVGDLSEEAAMNHPRRNEISRLLGDQHHQPDDRNFLEVKTFPLLPNSVLLLCSDGLTDMVTRDEISDILNQHISLEEKVKALINLANEKGGKDNITVVLIDCQNDEAADNIAAIENVSVETLCGEPGKTGNETPKKQKRNRFWVFLIAGSALLASATGGWFAKDYFFKENEKDIPADADTTGLQNDTIEIESLRTDSLMTDSLPGKL